MLEVAMMLQDGRIGLPSVPGSRKGQTVLVRELILASIRQTNFVQTPGESPWKALLNHAKFCFDTGHTDIFGNLADRLLTQYSESGWTEDMLLNIILEPTLSHMNTHQVPELFTLFSSSLEQVLEMLLAGLLDKADAPSFHPADLIMVFHWLEKILERPLQWFRSQ